MSFSLLFSSMAWQMITLTSSLKLKTDYNVSTSSHYWALSNLGTLSTGLHIISFVLKHLQEFIPRVGKHTRKIWPGGPNLTYYMMLERDSIAHPGRSWNDSGGSDSNSVDAPMSMLTLLGFELSDCGMEKNLAMPELSWSTWICHDLQDLSGTQKSPTVDFRKMISRSLFKVFVRARPLL